MRPIPDRLTPLECWPVHMTRQDKICSRSHPSPLYIYIVLLQNTDVGHNKSSVHFHAADLCSKSQNKISVHCKTWKVLRSSSALVCFHANNRIAESSKFGVLLILYFYLHAIFYIISCTYHPSQPASPLLECIVNHSYVSSFPCNRSANL